MTDYKVKAEGLNEALSAFFAITPPHMRPIDIEDALPHPEDLDHNGCCWWFHMNQYNDSCWTLMDANAASYTQCTHWLAAKYIVDPLAC